MLELRLLQVFDEIYKSRSVSRAADSLGIGQPAVSISLAKLREHFGDPLFVRIANAMEPTPLAKELKPSVLQALNSIERVYLHRATFDPATSTRTFRISMSDVGQLLLLPKLLPYLRHHSPGVHIDVLPQLEQTSKSLESGEADLVFGFMPPLENGFYAQALFHQRYVCLVSEDHPRIRDTLSLAQFETEEHAVVNLCSTFPPNLEQEIVRQNIRQNVTLRVPGYLGIALVIEQTDLLVTLPECVAQVLEGRGRFRTIPVPFDVPAYAVKQHWHERYHSDPGNGWLRQSIFNLMSNQPIQS